MKTITPLLIVSTLFWAIACSSEKDNDSSIVKIDAHKNYPVLNLKLSDIADVSYIPLKGSSNPSLMYISSTVIPRHVFITKDKIFINDCNRTDPKIIVYNRSGEPLYRIGQRGNGPGEYLNPVSFIVDTVRNEIFIWDNTIKKIYVFDLSGLFIKSKSFDNECIGLTSNIDNINNNTLMIFSGNSVKIRGEWLRKQYGGDKIWVNGKRSLLYIDKDSLTLEEHPDINFGRAAPDALHLHSSCSILSSDNGAYIFTLRSDTTFFIDRNFKITPKFVNITHYSKNKYRTPNNIGIYPIAESERYIFLSTDIAYVYDERIDINDFKFFVYDKKTSKIYSCPGNIKSPIKSESMIFQFPEGGSMNSGYHIKSLSHSYFKEKYDSLPPQLKKIADNITENDGPVIMLIKFKK